MEVCGEHGSEIAYATTGRWDKCPACEQIETLVSEHDKEVEELKSTIEHLEEDIAGEDA